MDLLEHEFNPHKILYHIDRLKSLALGGDIAPVTVEIDPVAYCNHACAWCVDPEHYPYQLSDVTFNKLINELASFRVNEFKIEGIVFKGGGEPTLHPNFGAMITKTHELGFAIGIVSNGSRLIDWYEYLANYAAYVRISIDGPTPESHFAIHRRKDFNTIITGIQQLVNARGNNRHPIIGLSFAMDIHTVDLASQAIELADELNVNYALLRPPFFEEVGSKPTMSIQQAQKVREQLRQVALAYQGDLHVLVGDWRGDKEEQLMQAKILQQSGRRSFQRNDKRPIEHRTKRCLASPLLAVITANGSVYGCCNLRALPKWCFGQLDYANGKGFKEIWEGEQRKKILMKMHQTACINHCTHPLSRYNEIIEVLRDENKWHSEFV